jgi:hypothetical protein
MSFHALSFPSRSSYSCRFFILHKKFNDSSLTKRHVGDSHFLEVQDGNVKMCTCADIAFMLEREDAANGPITPVTIFPPNSSQSYCAYFFRQDLGR